MLASWNTLNKLYFHRSHTLGFIMRSRIQLNSKSTAVIRFDFMTFSPNHLKIYEVERQNKNLNRHLDVI